MNLNLPVIHDGEVFTAYMYRTMESNGFPRQVLFREIVHVDERIDEDREWIPPNLLYPDFNKYGDFGQVVLENLDRIYGVSFEQIVKKHTIFDCLRSFLSDKDKEKIGSFDNLYDFYHKVIHHCNFLDYHGTKLQYNTTQPINLRYCPECMKRDIERHGHAVAYLDHNFPYVFVCHEHNVPLVSINGDIPIRDQRYRRNLLPRNNRLYAQFVSEFLEKHPYEDFPLSISVFSKCFNNLMNYAPFHYSQFLYAVLFNDYIICKMNSLGSHYPVINNRNGTRDVALGPAITVPHICFCIMLTLFHSYSEFSDYIKNVSDYPAQNTQIARFVVRMLVGKEYRVKEANYLLWDPENGKYNIEMTLIHELCKTEIATTMLDFYNGKRCPSCDTQYTEEESETSEGFIAFPELTKKLQHTNNYRNQFLVDIRKYFWRNVYGEKYRPSSGL